MRVVVRRFESGDTDAVERINHRLERAANEHRVYPEDLSTNPDADLAIRPINDSLFVATDGEEIRGGAWLREQYFWVDGARHRVGWLKYPVAESLIDPQYAGVPASMLMQLLRQQPHLMALGMGGHDAPFARLLAGIKWRSYTIPFLFRISRPFNVLRGLSHARRRAWLRRLMDVAAWSGAGWVAHRALHAGTGRIGRSLTVTTEGAFAPWADSVWEDCRDGYGALAVRDAKTLDFLYPSSYPNLHRLRVSRGGTDIGWVCGQILPPGGSLAAQFGNLTVGVVTDTLARPSDATEVLAAGVRHLEDLGVDLVITYLSHEAWVAAARRMRFLPGPSAFAFYWSPQAESLLVQGALATRCHITRSDGDGPIIP